MRWLLLTLVAAGCSESSRVDLRWPELEGARSALLIIAREAPPLGPLVVAASLEENPRKLQVDLMDEEAVAPVDLTLVLYDRPLSVLGMIPGQQPLDDGGATRRLPRSGQYYRGGTADSATTWLAVPDSQLWNDLRLKERRDPSEICPEFELKRLPIRPHTDLSEVQLLSAFDENRAVVGTIDGQLYWATTEGVTPATHSSTAAPLFAVFHDHQDHFWWRGANGTFLSGDPELGFTPHPQVPDSSSYAWLDGPRDDSPFEIYSLGNLQTFLRFDGQAWVILLPAQTASLEHNGGVVWLGPGSGMAVGSNAQDLAIHRAGRTTTVPLIGSASDEIRNLRYLPDFGYLVGTARGHLLQSPDGVAYAPLDAFSTTDLVIRALEPYGVDLFLSGNDGIIQIYVPDYGFCAPISTGLGRIELATRLGDLLLVSQTSPANARTTDLVLLVPR